MRSVSLAAFAAMAAMLAVGCGGGAQGKKRAPVGPSLQTVLASCKDSAARSVLLQYAEKRRDEAVAEVNRLTPPDLPPASGTSAPGVEARPPGSMPTPVRTGPAPLGPPNTQPVASPPASGTNPASASATEKLLKAQNDMACWAALITDLKGPNAAKCFVVKEWQLGEAQADRATSRLVVGLAGTHAGLASADLPFELVWRRFIRPGGYKDAPKADWELSDHRLIAAGDSEKKPDE